jgi:hypothetical protein
MESDSSSIKEPPDIRFNPNSIILHLKQIQISDRLLKAFQKGQFVMLNLFQHPVKSTINETLEQVQGDRNRLFQLHAKIQKLLKNIKQAFAIVPCHSGLAGIFLRFFSVYTCVQKDSRQAGMTCNVCNYADLSRHRSLVAVQKETETSYS